MLRMDNAEPLAMALRGATTRLFIQAKRSHSRPCTNRYSSKALSETTLGPELPLGRSAKSMRNTKPCSVVSPIKACIIFTARLKYSWQLIRPRPSVMPVVSPSSS